MGMRWWSSHTKVVLLWHPFLASRSVQINKKKCEKCIQLHLPNVLFLCSFLPDISRDRLSVCCVGGCLLFVGEVKLLCHNVKSECCDVKSLVISNCFKLVSIFPLFNVENLDCTRWYWLSNSSKPWHLPQLCHSFFGFSCDGFTLRWS